MSLSSAKTPVYVQPRRSIGGLYPDVVVEESHEDSLQITGHPVEQGAAVNDHAFKKPELVTIRGGVTDSSAGGGEKPSGEFYDKLLELQAKREPFDLVTGKRLHKNMLIERLSVISNEDSEHCVLFTAECRQVIIVATRSATVPPRAKHANPAKTGGTEDKGQKQPPRQSIMAGAAGGGKVYRQ